MICLIEVENFPINIVQNKYQPHEFAKALYLCPILLDLLLATKMHPSNVEHSYVRIFNFSSNRLACRHDRILI